MWVHAGNDLAMQCIEVEFHLGVESQLGILRRMQICIWYAHICVLSVLLFVDVCLFWLGVVLVVILALRRSMFDFFFMLV